MSKIKGEAAGILARDEEKGERKEKKGKKGGTRRKVLFPVVTDHMLHVAGL